LNCQQVRQARIAQTAPKSAKFVLNAAAFTRLSSITLSPN